MPSRRVVYGPFPARRGRAAFGLLWLVLGAGLSAASACETTFRCARERPGDGGTCVVEERVPLLGTRRHARPASDFVAVRGEYRPASRRGSSGHYEVVLLDQRGVALSVASNLAREEARRIRVRLQRFLGDESVPAVRVESGRSGVALVISAFALGVTVVLLASAFRGAGRFRIEVDRANDELRILRTLFAIPRSRSRLRAGDVTGVRIEWGPVADAWRPANHLPERGGRLVLVLSDGRAVPLSEQVLRGERVHARGLEALRAALDLPPPPEPPSAVPVEPSATRRSRRIPATVAAVVAVVIGVSVLLQVIVVERANRTEGWLVIRATNRCEFDNGTLLPGGEMRMSLRPGTYQIRVWSPTAPDHWEDQTFRVTLGHTTVVTCTPKN